MNYKNAVKLTKALYPLLKPTRPSGFSIINDEGDGAVVIAGFDEEVSLIISNKDIETLKNICEMAIKWKERKTRECEV
jgi:flagellar motor component MotA